MRWLVLQVGACRTPLLAFENSREAKRRGPGIVGMLELTQSCLTHGPRHDLPKRPTSIPAKLQAFSAALSAASS